LIASIDQITGFALARLLVKTAAAENNGPVFSTTVRSNPPEDFNPAATEPALKPSAKVTLTV
jgi:hypothetical protein